VCTRASITGNLARILARKRARDGRVGEQVGEDCRACPARGRLNAPRHADFRAEVGEDVRIGVGPMEFKLYCTRTVLLSSRPTAIPVRQRRRLLYTAGRLFAADVGRAVNTDTGDAVGRHE